MFTTFIVSLYNTFYFYEKIIRRLQISGGGLTSYRLSRNYVRFSDKSGYFGYVGRKWVRANFIPFFLCVTLVMYHHKKGYKKGS